MGRGRGETKSKREFRREGQSFANGTSGKNGLTGRSKNEHPLEIGERRSSNIDVENSDPLRG